jgi:hypothetical protein
MHDDELIAGLIKRLFRGASRPGIPSEELPRGTFIERLPAGDLEADPEMNSIGEAIALSSILKQLPALPSAAGAGVRPRADLDVGLFSSGRAVHPGDITAGNMRQRIFRTEGRNI